MVWDIVSKKFKFSQQSQVSHLHWRLLLSYLGVMGAILAVFGTGTYLFVSHSLYRQLDKKLLTLAQSATPFHARIQQEGRKYVDNVDEVPWRDIFNRDQQSLEWFDEQGRLLATRGNLTVDASPETGAQTREIESSMYDVRSYTISVFRDRATSKEPVLEGYIRASQSTKEIEIAQQQLLWGLITGGTIAVGLATAGGVWLTRKALAPVEQNYQKLQQFTADASHELRSPLAVIKNSVEVIQNHPERINPKNVNKINAIGSATEQMSRLIENLLFLARSDSQQTPQPTSWRPIALQEVLEDLVDLFEAVAESKEITIHTEFKEEAAVMGDGHQLHRLFANLLRNAIQHTPAGGSVTVGLSNTRNRRRNHLPRYVTSSSPRVCQVSISDTGIGIPAEKQPLVFERFWQADRSRSHLQQGTGLGLPIACAIAQQHGGRITLTSEPGKGSCFTVRLPLLPSKLAPS